MLPANKYFLLFIILCLLKWQTIFPQQIFSTFFTRFAISDSSLTKTYFTKTNKLPKPQINTSKKLIVEYPAILKGNEKESIEYVKMFSKRRRGYTIRMYTEGKKLLLNAAAILKRHKLPEELRVLLALESAYDSNAISIKGAVGYWQMIDAVAEEFELKFTQQPSEKALRKILRNNNQRDSFLQKFNDEKDERKNFVKATNAAALYLKDRFRNLDNNILLAVASYNVGVGNIWQIMKKIGKKHPTFWDIKAYLPAETNAYVMNFIALNVLFHNYDNFIKKKLNFNIELKFSDLEVVSLKN